MTTYKAYGSDNPKSGNSSTKIKTETGVAKAPGNCGGSVSSKKRAPQKI